MSILVRIILIGWDERYEDWLEFYNSSSEAISLNGYWLSDDFENPMKWQIGQNVIVPAGGYLVYLLSGTGEYDPNFADFTARNTSFKVTQTKGEEIVFSNPEGIILEYYDFETTGVLQANHSFARVSDGSNEWKICIEPTHEISNNNSTFVESYSSNILMSSQAGYYSNSLVLTLTTEDTNAEIRYTTDGSEPGLFSYLYTEPIVLEITTVVKARSFIENPLIHPGFIETSTFFFGEDIHTFPVVSISGNSLADGTWQGHEVSTLEYFQPGGSFVDEAHGDTNEHGNDSNSYLQRGFDFIIRDSHGYDHQLDHQVFHHRSRDHFERLIFKACGNSNYSFASGAQIQDALVHEMSILAGLELDERANEFVIMYINGVYKGVYQCQEKVDDNDYFEEYYNQRKGTVDYLKTWGGTWTEYGGIDDWTDLIDYAGLSDLSDEANYDYVENQVEAASLRDFIILNTFCVNTCWINWDQSWWRGRDEDGEALKWRYSLWDMDCVFDNYINYTGLGSTGPLAIPCEITNLGDPSNQGHLPLFNAMMENSDFYCDYVSRYYNLINGPFQLENMLYLVDSLETLLSPEMPRQINLWGGSYEGWIEELDELSNFLTERSENISGILENCYEFSPLTITVVVEGEGSVLVNGVEVNQNSSPMEIYMCVEMPVTLQVLGAYGCGIFEGWSILEGTAEIEQAEGAISYLIGSEDIVLSAIFSSTPSALSLNCNVVSEGQGTVNINGVGYDNFPIDVSITEGANSNALAIASEGFEFAYWESNNLELFPNEFASFVSFMTCENADITAVFVPYIGIAEEFSSSVFIIYPNPTSDFCTVKWQGNVDSLSLFDVTGKLVGIYDVGDVSSAKIQLNYAPGLYNLVSNHGDTIRLVIEK
jgi:hypothetical protein